MVIYNEVNIYIGNISKLYVEPIRQICLGRLIYLYKPDFYILYKIYWIYKIYIVIFIYYSDTFHLHLTNSIYYIKSKCQYDVGKALYSNVCKLYT